MTEFNPALTEKELSLLSEASGALTRLVTSAPGFQELPEEEKTARIENADNKANEVFAELRTIN